MKSIKMMAILLTPLLLFAILLVPYSLVNQHFIVDWLGCGCPVIDEAGNMVENNFNANDFTALFWLFISICVTAISVFLSKRIQKEKMWFRVLYILGMFLVSLFITYQFCRIMMWN
jgi:formate hydrogenlyase subunit 3/multisubunit Na+/H+ antiporter MnhD subunit